MRGVPFDEDAYWERRREEWENPRTFRSPWDEGEPMYEPGYAFLDEKLEDIETEKGWPIEELAEADLLEILEEERGIVAETAKWNPRMHSIDYTVRVG